MSVVDAEVRRACKAALSMAARFAVLLEFTDSEFLALARGYVSAARAEIEAEARDLDPRT